MSRKAILICVSAVAVLVIGVAVAVSVLYSGVDTGGRDRSAKVDLSDGEFALFQAVPSDAVAVIEFSSLQSAFGILASSPLISTLAEGRGDYSGFISRLRSAGGKLMSDHAVLSFHYSGRLVPLLVADAGRAGSEAGDDVRAVMAMADSAGLYSSYVDCADIADRSSCLRRRSLLLISPSDALIQSAERHVSKGISVMSLDGFVNAAGMAGGDVRILLPNTHADKLASEFFSPGYRKYAGFLKHAADWTVLSVAGTGNGLTYSGAFYGSAGMDEFMNVLASSSASSSSVAEVLPSYTAYVFSLPMGDASDYISAYRKFLDTRTGLAKYESGLRALSESAGVSPSEWASELEIREVAVAGFYVGDRLEKVVCVRTGNRNPDLVFRGTGFASAREYDNSVQEYAYSGFAASIFGSLFSAEDESCFILRDGWIISGSRAALDEYVSGRATYNPLANYLTDAGCSSSLKEKGITFFSYVSLSEDRRLLSDVFRKEYGNAVAASLEGASLAPVFFRTDRDGGFYAYSGRIGEFRSKAPSFERDTVVKIPAGPFRVKNSGTGRMNLFYQQDNMYLCLQELDGKGIWGVRFDKPICGCAQTVDYFANGKLQILFAAGSELYLIDRLGRPVAPFPVKLDGEVLLGPDVYDFNGKRKYNVMVLHKDNRIDMYNLQGRKPDAWKSIAPKEKVMGLPEAVRASGRTWWVVRTSIQTLIYPFYGGEPVTVFDGDRMIRPDSKVVPVSGGVEVTRYDGRKSVIELK